MLFGRKTFEQLNPDWRRHEDASETKKKNPNFEAYMRAHKGPSWGAESGIKKHLLEYEPWVEFKSNKKSEIILANELFNRYFLSKWYEGQYTPDPDAVLIRHLFIEVSDRNIITIDSEGFLLHERTEMYGWIKMYENIEKAFEAITKKGVYHISYVDEHGNEIKILYGSVHSKAVRTEYGLYQHMGEKILNIKLPAKAFLYAHPINEARGYPPKAKIERNIKYNEIIKNEATPTLEQIELATKVFEIGGYHYIDKKRVIETP